MSSLQKRRLDIYRLAEVQVKSFLGKRKNIFCIAAKNFTYAPGLCIAAAAVMWCISIKNFRDGTNTSIIKLFLYRLEVISCLKE